MGTRLVEVVTRSVEVSWQKEDAVVTVLLAICLALHQEHFLGDDALNFPGPALDDGFQGPIDIWLDMSDVCKRDANCIHRLPARI